MNAKPAHKLSITKAKGHYTATCSCGWRLPRKTMTSEEVIAQYNLHTGNREKR